MLRLDDQRSWTTSVLFNPAQNNGAIEVQSMRSKAICRNPDILGETPVFSGTSGEAQAVGEVGVEFLAVDA